jgi:hypothetical protein
MGFNEAISGLNTTQDSLQVTNNVLKTSERIQPIYEMKSASDLPKKLQNPLPVSTAEKLRQAIFALLSGQSQNISDQDGLPAQTGECNDPMQNENKYNQTFSLAKHIVSKEVITEYETQGIQKTIIPRQDPVTKLTKYDVKITQQDPPEPIPQADGTIKPGEVLKFKSQDVVPTEYTGDKKLQTLVNSIIVTVSNAVAEAVTKIIMAKIENNQTDIYIEWNPSERHSVQYLRVSGPVSPGYQGSVLSMEQGEIAFKGGTEYAHKCRIKFSDL